MLLLADKLRISAVVLVLAFLFSPGLLLTLPPKSGSTLGLLGFGVLNSKETHILSMFVHAVVIALLMFLLLTYAPLIQTIGESEEAVEETTEESEEDVEGVVEDVEEEVEEVEGEGQ